MNPILFLGLVSILSAVLPWWPADRGIIARGIGCWIHRRAKITELGKDQHDLDRNAYEAKIFNQREETQSCTGNIAKSGDEGMRWHVEN